MRYLFKPETIGDLRNIPVRLLQQDLGFLYDPAADKVGGCLVRGLFQNLVQVVDMDGQNVRIILGRTQAQPLEGRFDGELAFEQLYKQRGDAGRGIVGRGQRANGLQLLPIVDQLYHIIS